jgi:hypothetical protein
MRYALEKTGMSREDAAGYMFHGWRYYFKS